MLYSINPLSYGALFSSALSEDCYYQSKDGKILITEGILQKGCINKVVLDELIKRKFINISEQNNPINTMIKILIPHHIDILI